MTVEAIVLMRVFAIVRNAGSCVGLLRTPRRVSLRGEPEQAARGAIGTRRNSTIASSYERRGDVENVVFPCGTTLDADGDTLNVYYGAADTSIALATGSIRTMLAWLERYGSPGDQGD